MKHHYCTCFDKGYAPRGLALHRSLLRHAGDFHLWVLCLDEATHALLKKLRLKHVTPVSLSQLEQHDPALLAVKPQRSTVEYYFTTSPCFPSYLLDTRPEIEDITYLDADLFFFRSPEPLWAEAGNADVVIIPHRFPPAKKDCEKYGTYNVSWVGFRRSANGLQCLRWWRERCLEWCHDRLDEQGRYADQKYLDQFPSLFAGVHVILHPGADLAPWNIASHTLRAGSDGVLVDGRPLLFYHFHNLTQVGDHTYDIGLRRYEIDCTPVIEVSLYRPYLKTLEKCQIFPLGNIRPAPDQVSGPVIQVPRTDLLSQIRRLWNRGTFGGAATAPANYPSPVAPVPVPALPTRSAVQAIAALEKALRKRRESGWWFLSPRAWALRVARDELKRQLPPPPPEKPL